MIILTLFILVFSKIWRILRYSNVCLYLIPPGLWLTHTNVLLKITELVQKFQCWFETICSIKFKQRTVKAGIKTAWIAFLLPWSSGASSGWLFSAGTETAVGKTKCCSAENFFPGELLSLDKYILKIIEFWRSLADLQEQKLLFGIIK